MAKIKWVLISASVICAIAGAFASTYKIPCESLQQYYKFGMNTYFPAGTYGIDYYCQYGPGNCTWYQPNIYNPNAYAPCHMGVFQFTFLKNK
ncbi:hypothetical protein A4H97_29985 [Niastella yeongjuensis]|uniref:Uncharacterized protein n=1 Tax=Niastella yeongjuensis TaxID=354355 RepID=A0A1V9EQA5_9BACT|nr:hypothetical protein [Niastella yeongjuensis]OQP48065.1 hypothetical protein A4H97_29985 [Niastella yeongjuensis]SEO25412.1 hypothetical protein SAMN05660816_02398 [Niastella yeongjuensis]